MPLHFELTVSGLKVSSAVNLGLEILEAPSARGTLVNLGLAVVEEWYAKGGRPPSFKAEMLRYVNYFLSRIRNDFPLVEVKHIGGPDIPAATSRLDTPPWTGDDLLDYEPKLATAISLNTGVSQYLVITFVVPSLFISYRVIWFSCSC